MCLSYSGYLNFEQFKVLVVLLSNLGVTRDKFMGIMDGRITKFFTSLDTDRDGRIVRPEVYVSLHSRPTCSCGCSLRTTCTGYCRGELAHYFDQLANTARSHLQVETTGIG